MNVIHEPADNRTLRKIRAALSDCYGSLGEPDFRKISGRLDNPRQHEVMQALLRKGIEILETTDENDDVSTQLVARRSGEQVGIGLSGVGPFAVVLHQGLDGEYRWVTGPDDASSSLASLIAETVERAGYELLDRKMVERRIRMKRADGSGEATLYQALFTDTDRIP
jgi:hypothetical protein